jgi:hypothetical protein
MEHVSTQGIRKESTWKKDYNTRGQATLRVCSFALIYLCLLRGPILDLKLVPEGIKPPLGLGAAETNVSAVAYTGVKKMHTFSRI